MPASEHLLAGLASIVALATGAQWLAWRLHLPAILLLLLAGFVAGPVTHLIDPDRLLGDLLLPLVSLAVGIILFEGGLSLRFHELRETGRVFRNLITVGALATWGLTTLIARWVVGLSWDLSLLLGAILVVTGPTVIIPLLRHVRPSGRVGAIVKWEGIVNDPIGAILAVLVFEEIMAGRLGESAGFMVVALLETMLLGGAIGALGAGLLVLLLWRYWLPDHLHTPTALALAVGAFALSDGLQPESGLVAVTVMGILLANQRRVSIAHIIEFKENLRVMLISTLFVVLAARLRPADLAALDAASVLLVVLLILVVRPVAVALSTWRSRLTWKERVFIAWMAPRGIVAASVTSVFALDLSLSGHPQADRLVPLMFLIISATVAVYGLTAGPLARALGLATANPQGCLIVGAHAWARAIARTLREQGYKVLLVDTNRANLHAARMERLPTHYGSALAEFIVDELDLSGIGRLLALTPNDEVNALAALHFVEVFGRSRVYQLPSRGPATTEGNAIAPAFMARPLFAPGASFAQLAQRFEREAVVKTTRLTEEFGWQDFLDLYGESALPLFLIDEDGGLTVCTAQDVLRPRPGQTLISLVDEPEEERREAPALSHDDG